MPQAPTLPEPAVRPERRHDIDWLRVIAIGLLVLYHIVVIFQPWAILIGFPQSTSSLEGLWVPMSLLNVFRIPLLFAVSGMGVAFAMRRRSWRQLILERMRRILLPLAFGFFAIVPLHVFVFQRFYEQPYEYSPGLGHLWFLANIFAYVLLLAPVFYYLRARPRNPLIRTLRLLSWSPAGLLLLTLPFMIEAQLAEPDVFAAYAFSAHGFWLGMVAFFLGFCFVLTGDVFWNAARRGRWFALGLAASLYAVRLAFFELEAASWLMGLESMTWLLAVFGFGYAHLNRPSRTLRYLSEASYPVYIIHMAFLYASAAVILPLDLPTIPKLLIIVATSFVGCYATYDLIIRRIGPLRPLLGLRVVRESSNKYPQT